MEDPEEKEPFEDASEQNQIDQLEVEKEKLRSEFNQQRAKMKELFLQKEDELSRSAKENSALKEDIEKLQHELDDCKSQMVVKGLTLESSFEEEKRKAAEEIATLQQLIHETVEESSSTRILYDNELKKLQTYIQQLQYEIRELKIENQALHNSSQEHSLGPGNVLNALTKGIAKKLGADSFTSQDCTDENVKKNESDYAQEEDAEVLRSLVEPLEDQIKALKEKLRHTDELLQKCRECGHQQDTDPSSIRIPIQHTAATNTSLDGTARQSCDMCSNYEAQLQREQQRVLELEGLTGAAEKAAERHREELLKEIGFRQEMEEKWNQKREEHRLQVAELTRGVECAEQDLKELKEYLNQSCKEMRLTLAKLTADREKIHQELDKLQKENDNLIGKYTIHSQELQSEAINLPNTVEELHELILRNHQELIIAKIGKEAAEEKMNTFQSDIVLLRDQIIAEQNAKSTLESELMQEIQTLRRQKQQLEKERGLYLSNQETHQKKILELQALLTEALNAKRHLEEISNELKTRNASLQQELDTSETVQKDFVRLSQSLQVQLEKIRASDTQVRWQFEEDVNECPGCHGGFTGGKKKLHCMHCGQVFCPSCLCRTVKSGPNMRPSRVCDVCHTLLVQSSAPYFSEAPPMT